GIAVSIRVCPASLFRGLVFRPGRRGGTRRHHAARPRGIPPHAVAAAARTLRAARLNEPAPLRGQPHRDRVCETIRVRTIAPGGARTATRARTSTRTA